MNALLKPILKSPALPAHLAELERAMEAERQRREVFYDEITEDHTWEFINGQVFMHSPSRLAHSVVVDNLHFALRQHIRAHRLGWIGSEKSLCIFPRNDYEPDIVFFGPAKARLFKPDTMKFPVPDFIVEVLSPSTEKNDRGVKWEDYQTNGVGEYWLVDPDAKTVEQFLLKDGRYPKRVTARTAGILESTVIRGFKLPVKAVFDPDAALA
jgi:Uma2 family endonuclease